MKNIKSLTLAFIIIISFSGCKKEKTETEVANRLYHVSSLVIDGVDFTNAAVTDSLYSNFDFGYSGSHDKLIYAFRCDCNNNTGAQGYIGNWEVNEEKKTIVILFRSSLSNDCGPFWKFEYIEWNIKSFSSKELWLEVIYNGKLCDLHLASIH